MYVVVYVDDILLTGSEDKLVQDIVHKLNLEFALKTLGSLKYFLGFEVQRTASTIHMSQDKYAQDLLVKTGMSDSKPCSTPMALGNKLTFEDSELFDNLSLYWSTIGALQYLTLSRPDIAFFVNTLSQFLKAPTQLHWHVKDSFDTLKALPTLVLSSPKFKDFILNASLTLTGQEAFRTNA